MSKERELLKRCEIAIIEGEGYLVGLLGDIQELLAQPESNEPVAWIYNRSYGDEGLFVECVTTDYWEIDDQQQELGNCSNIRPLYTSPPTRKPLSDEDIEVWYSQHTWAMDKEEYMWGFRDAELAHGIGAEE